MATEEIIHFVFLIEKLWKLALTGRLCKVIVIISSMLMVIIIIIKIK